jgi:DNA-binding transcriptional regulator YiaG
VYHRLVSGEEVREARRRLGLTQLAFAERVGVERVTVMRWETKRSPVGRTAAILIQLLAKAAPKRARRTRQCR